jgi:hypothetical protein
LAIALFTPDGSTEMVLANPINASTPRSEPGTRLLATFLAKAHGR